VGRRRGMKIFLLALWGYLSLTIAFVGLGGVESKKLVRVFLAVSLLFLLFSYAFLTFQLFKGGIL
jgi:hypothetical protein